MSEATQFQPIPRGDMALMAIPGQNARWAMTINNWVPDRRLSLNGRHDAHWQTIKGLKNSTKKRVADFLADMPQARRVRFGWARVTVEFEFTQRRRRDPDNLAGMVKPLLDALVEAKVLIDDDCDHIELSIRARATGRYATTIEVNGVVSEVIEQLPLASPPRKAAPARRRRAEPPPEALEGLPY